MGWAKGDRAAGERAVLEVFLDFQRAEVVRKATDLEPIAAATRIPSSALTIGGLLKHLAMVEDWWFTEQMAGTASPWPTIDWDRDPDWEFRTGAVEPLEDLIALYQQAGERSRAVMARHGLDDLAVTAAHDEPTTLRWIVLHMIEETARHLGHLDLLREAADGQTG